jgi:hypothetical protein
MSLTESEINVIRNDDKPELLKHLEPERVLQGRRRALSAAAGVAAEAGRCKGGAPGWLQWYHA